MNIWAIAICLILLIIVDELAEIITLLDKEETK